MMEKCGSGPFGIYRMSKEDMKIGFLMALARAGDTPANVAENSKLADMYIEVIMKDRKRKKLENDITDERDNIEGDIRSEKNASDNIDNAKVSLKEIETLLLPLLDGDLTKRPESKEGQRFANERIYAQREIKGWEDELKDCQDRKARREKRIEEMTKELNALG